MVILLLLTAQRYQFIHTLEVKDISFTEDFVDTQISTLMKQTRPSFHLGPIGLQQFTKDTDLCIVHCLKTYLDKTKDLRSDGKLFISSQDPHKSLARGTISRWVKTVLKILALIPTHSQLIVLGQLLPPKLFQRDFSYVLFCMPSGGHNMYVAWM